MAAAPPTLRLRIHLQPRASRSRIVGRHGDALKVQVHAPPVAGAANAALVELIATTLGVPRRAVRVVQGASSRDKVVAVETADPSACQVHLDQAIHARVDKRGGGD